MTEIIPSVGIYRNEKHRYWWNGTGPFTSVTTAMSMYDKSDVLVNWAKKETALFALRNLHVLTGHLASHNSPEPGCPPCMKAYRPFSRQESARKWVSSIADYKRDAAADLGTRVHALAERMGQGHEDEVEPELRPFAVQYRRFIDERRPTFVEIEYMGVNLSYEYAGTGDIIADIDGKRLAIDIKTHTKDTPLPTTYYPETGMQLAACSRFEFIGKPDDPTPYPMPEVDGHAVLLVGRDDYRLVPYAVTGGTFGAFLDCLRLHRWKHGEAKTIVRPAA